MPTWLATMEECKALKAFRNKCTNAQIGSELERRFGFKVGSIDALAVQSIKNKWAKKPVNGNLKNVTGKMRGNPNNWVNHPCAASVAACKSVQPKPVPFGTRKQTMQKLKLKLTTAPAPKNLSAATVLAQQTESKRNGLQASRQEAVRFKRKAERAARCAQHLQAAARQRATRDDMVAREEHVVKQGN